MTASPISSKQIVHLDDRLQSSFSRTYSRRKLIKASVAVPEVSPVITWTKFKQISADLYGRNQAILQGEPVSVAVSAVSIAVATFKGTTFIYDEQQRVQCKIGSRDDETRFGPITCLRFSADSTYIAVGYKSGDILVYNLKAPQSPAFSIHPSGASHLDSQVISIAFIGVRYDQLVSINGSGVLTLHTYAKPMLLLPPKQTDIILMGSRQLQDDTIDYSRCILGFSMLPIGSLPQPTDSMAVMAIITPDALIVVSALPERRTYLKIKRPRGISQANLSASVCWFPATLDHQSGIVNPPLLAFCWNNCLSLFEVFAAEITDSLGRKSLMMRFENRKLWNCQENILNIQWLNSSVLACVTRSQLVCLVGRKHLKLLATIDMATKHLICSLLFEDNTIGLAHESYANTFKALKSNIFLLGKTGLYVGVVKNWADILFDKITDGQYIGALKVATDQYRGDCNLELIGLPQDNDARHKLLENRIKEIFNASVNDLFGDKLDSLSKDQRIDVLIQFLRVSLDTSVVILSDPSVYETLFDSYSANDAIDIFFPVLEDYLLASQIKTIPASVLKSLVEYYINSSNGAKLEQILCEMDITRLDIDLTMKLCIKHQLTDTLIYISNSLLCDYITPIFESIKSHRYESIYVYITYILTGRQYPTDRPIKPLTTRTSAKLNIYYVLFNGSSISYPKGTGKVHVTDRVEDEPAFPYLYTLLKNNSPLMFASLNEVFEDEILNDDEITSLVGKPYEMKVNRQYIIDVLLNLFKQNEHDFNDIDRVYLAIFVARNYPKYRQFIRLSDTVLNYLAEQLCSFPTKELKDECEMALRSLLSVYKPANYDTLAVMLKECGFYEALLDIFRSENKYYQILDLWVKSQQKSDSSKNSSSFIYQQFGSVPQMVSQCLSKSVDNGMNLLQVEKLIGGNFVTFIKDYPEEMAGVFSDKCPSLNQYVMKIDDSSNIKYRYLQSLFTMQFRGDLSYKLDDEMILEYVTLIKRYDPSNLKDFILKLGVIPDGVMSFLKENKEVEILIGISIKAGNYNEAFDAALTNLTSIGKEIVSSGNCNSDQEKRMWSLVDLCLAVVPKVGTIEHGKDLSESEALLLRLIECSVKLFDEANATTEDHPAVLKICKRVMQTVFTRAISQNEDSSDSFLRVFYEFLDRSSLKVTNLGDVRMVINEIYLSYSHDRVILSLILRLLNDDSYRDLVDLDTLEEKGWTLKHMDCEVCGKPIWGAQINPENFEEWQDYKMKEVSTNQHNSIMEDLGIYVFQCGHGYHRKCLSRMGVSANDNYCIICRESK